MSKRKTIPDRLAEIALTIMETCDIETARRMWNEAFSEAERITHNQTLGEPDALDHATAEQVERFDNAGEARQKFRVVT